MLLFVEETMPVCTKLRKQELFQDKTFQQFIFKNVIKTRLLI